MEPASVAAVITAHNVEPWIGAAIRSVFGQTAPPRLLVVVENGSTDQTRARIEEAVRDAPAGIVVESISADRPLGAAGARNHGAAIARDHGCTEVGYLDGDDWWEPAFLATLGRTLATGRAAAAFCWCWIRNESGSRRSLRWRLRKLYEYPHLCWNMSPMTTASAMYVSLDAQLAAGGFEAAVSPAEDWELLLRLAQRGGKVVCSRRLLVNYRRRPASLCTQTRSLVEALAAVQEAHPEARFARHWWWLLSRAVRAGDERLVEEIERYRPAVRLHDMMTPHLLIYAWHRTAARASSHG